MFTCPLSASSAPLRESILHAKAQRTQRLYSWIKVVRVARRRDAVSSQKPPSHKKHFPTNNHMGYLIRVSQAAV
jgi:hypothetical protein